MQNATAQLTLWPVIGGKVVGLGIGPPTMGLLVGGVERDPFVGEQV